MSRHVMPVSHKSKNDERAAAGEPGASPNSGSIKNEPKAPCVTIAILAGSSLWDRRLRAVQTALGNRQG